MIVSELIELLQRCPQNDIIVADIDGETESADVTDVLVGNGTLKGFCYIKVERAQKGTESAERHRKRRKRNSARSC